MSRRYNRPGFGGDLPFPLGFFLDYFWIQFRIFSDCFRCAKDCAGIFLDSNRIFSLGRRTDLIRAGFILDSNRSFFLGGAGWRWNLSGFCLNFFRVQESPLDLRRRISGFGLDFFGGTERIWDVVWILFGLFLGPRVSPGFAALHFWILFGFFWGPERLSGVVWILVGLFWSPSVSPEFSALDFWILFGFSGGPEWIFGVVCILFRFFLGPRVSSGFAA